MPVCQRMQYAGMGVSNRLEVLAWPCDWRDCGLSETVSASDGQEEARRRVGRVGNMIGRSLRFAHDQFRAGETAAGMRFHEETDEARIRRGDQGQVGRVAAGAGA